MSLASTNLSSEISPVLLSRFLALIAARTGLHIRDKDHDDFRRQLAQRMKALKVAHPDAYLQKLEVEEGVTGGEWMRLLPRLTNGESYFWRDKGQFSLLKTGLLPELIAARSTARTLRLWSAGCSTGEEPYSLAMLVDELLPQREGWNVTILGTDINDEALVKARRGLYGAWAFRGLDPSIQKRYFERTAQGYQISDKLRGMVRFAPCNLGSNDFPSPALGINDFDLILCRNVLIYFKPEAILHTLQRFALSLREGGYLLTGHAELANHNPAPLRARTFAESVAYQRCDGAAAPARPGNTIAVNNFVLARNPAKLPPTWRESRLPVVPLAVASLSALAAAPTHTAIKPVAGQAAALCERARQNADLGRYEEAAGLCREAIDLDATYADAYFIWAQVEGEQGQPATAKQLFKKVVYLDPSHFEAHLELAAIYDQENDASRARREREAALRLLGALEPTQLLVSHPGASAGELVTYLQNQLESTAAKGGR